MKELKKISFRLLLLLLLLTTLNFIYKKLYYDNYKGEYTEFVKLMDEISPDCKVLYVGESSNLTTRGDDMDKRWIHEFISSCYPDVPFCDITKPATHAGTYYAFLRAIPRDHPLETIIVTLNLRSFNTDWIHSTLEGNLQKKALMIQPYPPLINRTMLSFKAYDDYSAEERSAILLEDWKEDPLPVPEDFPHQNTREWDKWMANTGIKDSTGKRDQKQTELACHYIKGYAFMIDTTSNPRIRDLNKIVKLADKRGWNVVFNLMAENVDKANELLGESLVDIMDYNVDLLVDYYSRKGIIVANNFRNVRNDQFIDQNWTTEHYAEIGRKAVASCVADSLKKLYPDQYEDRLKLGNLVLFNDFENDKAGFEGKLIQSQEKAYRGKNATLVSPEHKYSQSASIQTSYANYSPNSIICLSARLLSEKPDCTGILVIEGKTDNKITVWRSFKIKNHINSPNQWDSMDIQTSMGDELSESESIKIFFMAEDDAFFVDNFRIEFIL